MKSAHARAKFVFLTSVIFTLAVFSSPSRAGSIDSEKINYGSACSGNIDAADWDTIAECSSSQWKRGPFFFGASSDSCDTNHAGLIRYNSSTTNIEFCNGTSWGNLSATGANSDYAGVVNAAAVTAGALHTCFLTSAGAAYCVGEETATANLGNGITTNTYSSKPLAVSGGYTFSKISPSEYGGCGLTTGGAIYCWGGNTAGQIGDNTTATRTTPVIVSGGYTWTDVASTGIDTSAATSAYSVTATNGLFANCGITGGAAYCWGDNTVGQLGTGNNTASKTPVAVTGGLTFSKLAVLNGGYAGHMCGITTAGAAYCWGENNDGQLGNGTTTNSNAPVAVSGSHVFASLSLGEYVTCGITTANAAYCWGSGSSYVLGNGSSATQTSPVAVSGSLSFSKTVSSDGSTLGLTTSGGIYLWGSNQLGLLGTASIYSTPNAYTTPSSVTGTKWVDIGISHNCGFFGVRDNGALYSFATNCSGGMNGTPQYGSPILMQ